MSIYNELVSEKAKLEEKIAEIEKEKLSPRKEKLDDYDKLYVENIMLKEQNETLRAKLASQSIVSDREKLHDFIVEKYNIDLSTHKFTVDGSRTLNIIPL